MLSLGVFAQQDAYQLNNLIRKGRAEYNKKNFKLALDYYEQVLALYQSTTEYYNAARCASLIGEQEKSALYLNKCIDQGYLDKEWMVKDSDFEGLKKTSDWAKIIANIDGKISAVEANFSGVKQFVLSDLVPFYQNGKWGYLSKNDRKVVIKPLFYKANFGGNCLSVEWDQQTFIQIDGNGKLKVHRPNNLGFPLPPVPTSRYSPKADSTKGFKGFKVSEYGRITHASAYYDESAPQTLEGTTGSMDGSMDMTMDESIEGHDTYLQRHPIVHSAVKIDGVWWAIASKNKKYGLIDEQGNIHKKILFNYQSLLLIGGTKKDEVWYFFKDLKNECGLINPKGEVKFYKEIDFVNLYSFENTGFAVARKGDLTGLIDLFSLEWAVKPAKHKILSIDFSYSDKCVNPYNLLRDRDKIKDIYFFCSDNDAMYYQDKNGIKYLPLK